MKFFDAAIKTGSQIAVDHGAKKVGLLYGSQVEHVPPSLGSGLSGQITESLFFIVGVSFEPIRRPVTRTRKFTMFNPENGVEVWPGGEMEVSDLGCRFALQVGNVTNPGWGVFASFRNTRLSAIVHQLSVLEAEPPMQRIRSASILPVDELETFGL